MTETELLKKKNEIHKNLVFINEKLERSPAGKLHLRKHRNSVQLHISCKNNKLHKTETRYVKKNEYPDMVPFFYKYYLELIRDELNKEMDLINYQTHVRLQDKGEIYDLLPELIKKEIKPLYTSVQYNIEKWYNAPFETNSFAFNQTDEYVTDLNETVRSRAECLLANTLNKMGLKYHYEELLTLQSGQKRYPDFKVAHPKTGTFYYIEFFGMMDQPDYAVNAFTKIAEYAADPVFPQMIYIFDHKDVAFSNVTVNNILKTVFM